MDATTPPTPIDDVLREVARTRGIAVALLRGEAAAEIDDVLQDASIAALAPDAPRGEAFAHWIRGAVRHLSVTVLRRRERRSIREREAARPVALPAADELAQRFALHRALLAAIEALSEPLRIAIVRRYFDDAKPREIAREQGVPVATVKTRLRRGLAQLRVALRGEWGEGYESALVVLSSGGTGVAMAGAFVMAAKWKAMLSAAAALAIVGIATVVVQQRAARQDASAGARANAASASGAHDDGGATRVAELAPARAPDSAPATAPAPGSRRARLGERRVAKLVGRVVDEQGAPCANVEVAILRPVLSELNVHSNALTPAVEGERHVTTSAADGSFAFDDLVRGAAFDVFANAGDGRRGRLFDIRAGVSDAPTVPLQATTSIEGVVVDGRDHSPVAGATVRIRNFRSDGRERLETTTDGNGRFALLDIGHDYTMVLAAAADGRCSAPYTSPFRPGGKVEFEIEVGAGPSAEGIVVDAESGEPIADAAVVLRAWSDLVATRTDEAGTFGIRSIDSWNTNVQVIVSAEGFAQVNATLTAAGSDRDTQMRANVVRLPRATEVVGRLVARDDAPLVGAVVLTDPSGAAEAQVTTTRADGSFRIEGLDPRGRHMLQIRGDECAWTSLPFPPAGGDGRFDFGSIVVETGALVTGSVACDDGTPLAGALVDAVFGDASSGNVTSGAEPLARPGIVDATGHFEVANLAAGRWTLRVTADGFRKKGELALDVDRDGFLDDVKLTIAAGLAITGRVVDARGAPIDHAFLMLLSLKQNPSDMPRPVASANADAAGRFRIGGLERGAFTLHVQPARPGEGRSVTRELARVEAGTVDLEITLPDGVFVSGRIVDGQGEPVAGASLDLVDAKGAKVSGGFSGRDGGFRLLAAPSTDAEDWSLAVRVFDRRRPGALSEQPPAATVDHVRGDGPPLTIVVGGK
jgi:RNA polymerase sigma-70 factor (ECF subfamily)